MWIVYYTFIDDNEPTHGDTFLCKGKPCDIKYHRPTECVWMVPGTHDPND